MRGSYIGLVVMPNARQNGIGRPRSRSQGISRQARWPPGASSASPSPQPSSSPAYVKDHEVTLPY
jgi:hypothetical protein